MRTQLVVAQWFQKAGFEFADSAGAGRTGSDILNVPGLAIEVKARTGFNPLAWVKQAIEARRAGELPQVVMRCNGQGEATVGDWIVLRPLREDTRLLYEAGYIPDPNVPWLLENVYEEMPGNQHDARDS